MVRRATEAYNRGDVDATLESWADDAVLDWSRSRGPDAGVYRGLGESRAFTQQLLDFFEIETEIIELRELREGLLLFDNLAHMTGRDGIETEARSSWLITIEGGKQTQVTMYQSKQDALDAAGLSE